MNESLSVKADGGNSPRKLSRNARYEAAKRAEGLEKVTLWLPIQVIPEFKSAADLCCEYRHLSINSMRDTKSGRYVSLERGVTGDSDG
ncbi:hypothetical protein [Grimontia sp. NTOU-MAR1]|uniref:hypothetical protein n=1 Tax=Grimontia sp. NTOU-MAR1 TaxID=3111011 RepID=UPI002DB5C23F|nr:hypothetical protein [Grimontia sp. NTOU-MAR1]WRV98272.1 hypothetical protein VP504_02205 [Grimontia sp. NTOU-MAR1]